MYASHVLFTIALAVRIVSNVTGKDGEQEDWFLEYTSTCRSYDRNDVCRDPQGKYACLVDGLKQAKDNEHIEFFEQSIKYMAVWLPSVDQGWPCLTAAAKNEKQRSWLEDFSHKCYSFSKGICKDYDGQIDCLKGGLTEVEGAPLQDIKRAIAMTKNKKLNQKPPCQKLADQNTCYEEQHLKLTVHIEKSAKARDIAKQCRILLDSLRGLKKLENDCPLQAKSTRTSIELYQHVYSHECQKD